MKDMRDQQNATKHESYPQFIIMYCMIQWYVFWWYEEDEHTYNIWMF